MGRHGGAANSLGRGATRPLLRGQGARRPPRRQGRLAAKPRRPSPARCGAGARLGALEPIPRAGDGAAHLGRGRRPARPRFERRRREAAGLVSAAHPLGEPRRFGARRRRFGRGGAGVGRVGRRAGRSGGRDRRADGSAESTVPPLRRKRFDRARIRRAAHVPDLRLRRRPGARRPRLALASRRRHRAARAAGRLRPGQRHPVGLLRPPAQRVGRPRGQRPGDRRPSRASPRRRDLVRCRGGAAAAAALALGFGQGGDRARPRRARLRPLARAAALRPGAG